MLQEHRVNCYTFHAKWRDKARAEAPQKGIISFMAGPVPQSPDPKAAVKAHMLMSMGRKADRSWMMPFHRVPPGRFFILGCQPDEAGREKAGSASEISQMAGKVASRPRQNRPCPKLPLPIGWIR